MNYEEWKNNKQKKFDELPIFYAFSDAQFAEQMNKRGLKETDTDQIYRFGRNGFYLKKDSDRIKNFFEEYDKSDKLSDLMNDHDFAVDAFLYEMNNHEYAINWQADWEVCNCFCEKECKYGDDKTYIEYLTEQGHENWISAYMEARKKHYKMADEMEWF